MPISESDIKAICTELITKAVALGREVYQAADLPMNELEITWLEEGSTGTRAHIVQRIDFEDFWEQCGERLRQSSEWMNAESTIAAYEKQLGTAIPSFFGMTLSYPIGLIEEYLFRAKRFEVLSGIIDSATVLLLEYCKSSTFPVVSLMALEYFSAASAFELTSNIQIRPISKDELVEFGIVNFQIDLRNASEQWRQLPSSDWWICELKTNVPKENISNFNNSERVLDYIPLALRLFQRGKIGAISLKTSPVGSFKFGMSTRSGITRDFTIRGDSFSFSEVDIARFQEFWGKFITLIQDESHYLQLPARRLAFGGQRIRLEDALVDYVIGLEALLCEGGLELSYRMSLRSAIILSLALDDKFERFKDMRNIYSMRSDIVHGNAFKSERIMWATQIAEDALRSIWNWFFENWAAEKNNKRAIDEIDSLLLSK